MATDCPLVRARRLIASLALGSEIVNSCRQWQETFGSGGHARLRCAVEFKAAHPRGPVLDQKSIGDDV